jgi:hypothetical protein
MRRVIVAAVLVLGLWGWAPKGEQLPLITLKDQTCCLLSFSVEDVDSETVQWMRWPTGYTAWRAGSEVEVRDPIGNVVLRTPGRYRMIPTWPGWAVGEITSCPGCQLGGGPL